MNELIKDQLRQVRVARLPHYNENSTKIIIPKFEEIKVSENEYYIIRLHSSVLKPSSNSVLSSNWNNGRVPAHEYYKCEITKVLGKMIKITGLAFDLSKNIDLDEMWEGWLPLNEIDLIQKL